MRAQMREVRLPRGLSQARVSSHVVSAIVVLVVALLIFLGGSSGNAEAHTTIQSVSASGKMLRITFSGPIRRGTIRATNSRGRVVSRGTGGRDPRNINRLFVPLRNVGSGRYRARWTMVAIDGHRQAGTLGFRVR